MAISNNGVTAVRPDAKTIEIPKEWKSAEGIAEELKKAKFRDIDSVEVHVDMTCKLNRRAWSTPHLCGYF